MPVEEVAARFGDAVWRVETEGCDWVGSGSAFAVDARHLVTNWHVVANDTSPLVRSRGGVVQQGRVVGQSAPADIAVIQVGEDLPLVLGWAPAETLQPAERLILIGYPVPALEFTYSWGTTVAFVGDETSPDAILSNAPIDRGNSGGPALRGDGTVAGVTTMMSLSNDPSQRVAIILTTDSVLAAVAEAIESPRAVLSDCGFGPDYVPAVPDSFGITAPPPPPTVPAAPSPTPLPSIHVPSTPSTEPLLPCPRGRVEATIDALTAEPVPESADLWDVQIEGTIANRTTTIVAIDSVEVAVVTDEMPTNVTATVAQSLLDPEHVTSWTAGPVTVRSPAAPTQADVAVAWSQPGHDLEHCATPDAYAR